MNEFYGGVVGDDHRQTAATIRPTPTPAACHPTAGTASTLSPTSPAYSPRLVPAVTGQGDYTPEELAFAEAYAREAMADSYPTTDTHYRS